MSISRLQAALAAVTNEVTLTAANLNFDFTLVKYEAPTEYQPLGQVLSRTRKEEAECGSAHITARRLGALFESLLPSTPNLLKAYGNRVSEIAAAARLEHLPQPENSIFAAHSGVDGTSIWAAATSSSAALQVQLLACMLARVWSSAEATSVWVELVGERRKEVATRWHNDEDLPFKTMTAAAQAEISRASLRQWDASTRAWLRIADRLKVKQQDQLMLIVANLNIPINKDMGVYPSVISAWKSALESMESLVSGMPQAATTGPTLLALSSWHLYPDLHIVGAAQSSHCFSDPLITAGGALTVGLAQPQQHPGQESESEPDKIHRGVFWSLSLAHLKFYGHPVQSEAALNLESAKMTFEQFAYATFGSLIGHWSMPGTRADDVVRFFLKAHNLLALHAKEEEGDDKIFTSFLRDHCHWFNIMYRAALAYDENRHVTSSITNKLFALGAKRTAVFLPRKSEQGPPPFLGFNGPHRVLSCLKGPVEEIRFLRAVNKFHRSDALIRYYVRDKDDPSIKYCGLATLTRLRIRSQPPKQREEGDATGSSSQTSETPVTPSQLNTCLYSHANWAPREILDGIEGDSSESLNEISIGESKSLGFHPTQFVLRQPPPPDGHEATKIVYDIVYGKFSSAAIFLPREVREGPTAETFKLSGSDEGDNATTDGSNSFMWEDHFRIPTVEDLVGCLDCNMISPERLLRHIQSLPAAPRPQDEVEALTLTALSTAARIYKVLPGGAIAPQVFEKPVYEAAWAAPLMLSLASMVRDHRARMDREPPSSSSAPAFGAAYRSNEISISLAQAFSCVAYMDTGLDIEPSYFNNVFAMAFEDSIYVSVQLLCDPYSDPPPHELRRVVGNIGKPGLTLLIPPTALMTRKPNPASWKVMSSANFNGLPEDHFSRTSMHLSFTEYYVPLVIQTPGGASSSRGQDQGGGQGGQDCPVYILEAVVSVHDSGEWVGDVDIPKALSAVVVKRAPPLPPPRPPTTTTNNKHDDNNSSRRRRSSSSSSSDTRNTPIITTITTEALSVETWEDVLDQTTSPQPFVVRAAGNWVARLAATALCVQCRESFHHLYYHHHSQRRVRYSKSGGSNGSTDDDDRSSGLVIICPPEEPLLRLGDLVPPPGSDFPLLGYWHHAAFIF